MKRRSFLKAIIGGLASLVGLRTVQAAPLDPLTRDIAANGILNPIVVHNGEIVDGHRRLAAAKALGIKNIPYTYV